LPLLQNIVRAHKGDMAVDWVASTTSTNLVLAREVDENNPYRLLGTDAQTAGRGRRERPWVSVAGDCLTFSLRLPAYRPAELPHLSSLPLVIGLAVIEATANWAQRRSLSMCGPLALKWPNDLLCQGKKAAGILIESKSTVVIGIGINVFFSPQLRDVLPHPVNTPTASPSSSAISPGGLLQPKQPLTPDDLANLVAAITLGVLDADALHRTVGLAPKVSAWTQVHAFQGQAVCLNDGDKPVLYGRVEGIGSQGELMLRDAADVLHKVLSGDLSLRAVLDT
jgi:BirA family transcriptional regulator, biotin operon repressor / biotin---[acetyl-CoA-carboxylase] ligase